MILDARQDSLFPITTQKKSNHPRSTQRSSLILQMYKKKLLSVCVCVCVCVCVWRNVYCSHCVCVILIVHVFAVLKMSTCVSMQLHGSLREQYISNFTRQEQDEIWADTVTLIWKRKARSKGWV